MANKNRNKGIYHEKWFETWLKKIGINVKRQPMSGALGGEYIGDLLYVLTKDGEGGGVDAVGDKLKEDWMS